MPISSTRPSLDEDRRAPRKQRHTARRIHRRILTEFSGTAVAESTVRNHVRERKRQMGLERRETFVPQSYSWAQEAQVDWYEAWVDLGGERTRMQVFAMRSMASGAAFHRAYLHATQQRGHLLARVTEGFDLAEVVFPLVDKQGCVTAKTNYYSVPVRPGARVEARVHPLHIEIWHAGRLVARHERCHSRRQHVLDLEHYLGVLSHKPGAFAGSKPLAQWRAAGRWPACYDELWDRLRARHGKQNGTRAMIAVLALGQEFGHDRLRTAVASTVSLGACDVAAVRYLLIEAGLHKARTEPIDVGVLARYDRPLPDLAAYDTLLSGPCAAPRDG